MKARTNSKTHRGGRKPGARKKLAAVKLRWSEYLWRHTRRVVVFVVGSTVVLIGVIMLVLPGPGSLVIPLGLAILATEFAWAAWLLKVAKQRLKQLVSSAESAPASDEETAVPQKAANAADQATDFAADTDQTGKH